MRNENDTVAVLGLGPIGLLVCTALKEKGFNPIGYEVNTRGSIFDPTSNQGYGLTCDAAVVKYIQDLVGDSIRDHFIVLKKIEKFETTGESAHDQAHTSEQKCVINRGQLVTTLISKLEEMNVQLNFGKKIDENFINELNENPLVQNIIDCTGIHSIVRNHLFGDTAVYRKIRTYYGKFLNTDDVVSNFVGTEFEVIEKRGLRLLCKPTTSTEYGWQICANEDMFSQIDFTQPGTKDTNLVKIMHIIINHMKEHGWSQDFISMIEKTPSTTKSIRVGRISDREPIDVSFIEDKRQNGDMGKFVMIGDSLHSMVPYIDGGFNTGVVGVMCYMRNLQPVNDASVVDWNQVNGNYECHHLSYATQKQRESLEKATLCHF